MSARRRSDWLRIEDTVQMRHEAEKRGFVFVELTIAQEYLLNHEFEANDPLKFEPGPVPGVIRVTHHDPL